MKNLPIALTIAGSDSSGGAGIQADLKTFAAFEVFGTSVISSVTSQNSSGINSKYDLPQDVITSQLEAIFDDQRPGAVKTGMLGNEFIVERIATLLKNFRIKKLVVDPIIKSSTGTTLLSRKGVDTLKSKILRRSILVTPNIMEAQWLSGIRINKPKDFLKAARIILQTGTKAVLIKGGHARGNADDFFFDGKQNLILKSPRLVKVNLHGTGCVLSAAITAGLAQGNDLITSVRNAKDFIRLAIEYSVFPGKGAGCVQPLADLYRIRERWNLFKRVSLAIDILKEHKIGGLVPEVQSNLAVGLKRSIRINDIIGIPGRIIKKGEDIFVLSPPSFGGSRHVADIVLTVMKHDATKRAVMNIKYTDKLLMICRKLKFEIASFNRKDEPRKISLKEGSSLEWGTDKAIRGFGSVPDIIYDMGGTGKEEMIRVIAEDVETLVKKVLLIHRTWQKGK